MGYVAAKLGLEKLTSDRAEDEELIAIVENDSCAVDAIQFLTGCTFGKGNLFFRDHGKHVYTFALRPSGTAVRISRRAEAPSARTGEDRDSRIRRMLSQDPEEMYDVQLTTVQLPPAAEVRQSVVCSGCSEPVMETRAVIIEGKPYCLPCAAEKCPQE